MNIQNTNNINFQGGYKFTGVSKAARSGFARLPKGKLVVGSFEGGKENFFVAARDNLHPQIANWIKEYGVSCVYYPNLKINMIRPGIKHESLRELLDSQQSEELVFDETMEKQVRMKNKTSFVEQNSNKYVANILKTLKIDMDKSTLKSKYGAKLFENIGHTKSVAISAPNNEMVHYVKVISKVSTSAHEPDEMYAMTSDGEIIRDYTNDIENWSLFRKRFNAALIK